MNEREGVAFLFTIAKEIQLSFTSPVILFTQKDYAENIFSTSRNVHAALLKQEPPEKFAEIISLFHIDWLDAVLDVDMFSKRVKDTPREVILGALDYTMHCTQLRYNHILELFDEMRSTMTEQENKAMQTHLTIIKDMQDTVNSALLEKQQYIRSQADQKEYLARIYDETEELLHWMDGLNDHLAKEICKILNFKVPLVPTSLTMTLKQIIDEVATDSAPELQTVVDLYHAGRRLLTSEDQLNKDNELEIAKIIIKIKALEARISRLNAENSSALMALKHKILFLEERLQSLENIKISMKKLKKQSRVQDADEKLYEHRPSSIFNHLLPHKHRCRLVEQLIQLWNYALTAKEHDHESIIDILSIIDVDAKEVYTDKRGHFTVDKSGRKIYTTGDDDILYQLNEYNILVPVCDDEQHVYYYDACGRYYLNDTGCRVYKNHHGANEYLLNKDGLLVKILEEKDGVVYLFDNLGRYYINAEGRQIYCIEDSKVEYEQDGLGNLVKIRDESFFYTPCPTEPITIEENKYLKREIGDALKNCIAKVVVHQPTDPIAYLADLLTKYNDSMKAHQKHLEDEQERFELSQLIHTTKDK